MLFSTHTERERERESITLRKGYSSDRHISLIYLQQIFISAKFVVYRKKNNNKNK